MRPRLSRLFLLLLLLAGRGAWAEGGYADSTRYVFAPLADTPMIAVIDSRADRVVGQLDAGGVARYLEVAPDLGQVIVADGKVAAVHFLDLISMRRQRLDLDLVPDRLLVSGGGRYVAALNMGQGRGVVIDVAKAAVITRFGGFGRVNDALFDADGVNLYLAISGRSGIAVVDADSGRLRWEISAADVGEIIALSRAPSGRVAYAVAGDGSGVQVLDLKAGRFSGAVAGSTSVRRAFTNAVGITLVLPDDDRGEVAFVAASSLRTKAVLKGGGGMRGVYSGWFDTVTFVSAATQKAVLVYDQQSLVRGDDISLPGIPGRGTVTPDGKKVYLPLDGIAALAVIDAERRTLSGLVALPGNPLFAVMGRTFGICH